MPIPLAVFSLTLGLAQIIASFNRWRTMSLVGPSRLLGYGAGLILIALGSWGVVNASLFPTVLWPLLTVPLSLIILLLAGSVVAAPTHPDQLFSHSHPAHAGCVAVSIPHDDEVIPGLLLQPQPQIRLNRAVCIIHGSGDNKRNFKWRLVQALLEQGLTVLTIDLPGHGDFLHRTLKVPDCLPVVTTAMRYLQAQPNIERAGLLGISLGGAVALRSLADHPQTPVDALAILETPLSVDYTKQLFYREAWRTFNAPILSIYQDISVRQIRQSWQEGAIRSEQSTSETFALLDPLGSIGRLDSSLPILLVYSQRDSIAPVSHGQQLQQAAPQAKLITIKKSSHVTLILMAEVNRQIAEWLRQALV